MYHILNFLDISLPTLATLNYMGAITGKATANSQNNVHVLQLCSYIQS